MMCENKGIDEDLTGSTYSAVSRKSNKVTKQKIK